MILPKEKTKATQVSPSSLLLYSPPKAGKTTAISYLDDCLLVDLEKGSGYTESMNVSINSLEQFLELNKALKEEKDKIGKNPYKYIAIDTVTKLEEIAWEYAVVLYKATTIGVNFKGTGMDLQNMAHGSGYGWHRKAMVTLIDALASKCDRIILIGHVKDKVVASDDGADIVVKDVSLTGKLASIIPAYVDAIAFLQRKKGQIVLNFKAGGRDVIAGTRATHLAGKSIVLADEEGYYWNRVFLD